MEGNKELVGVKEIARRANVSIGTVDRVLHNRTGVSKKTKDKILAIIEELAYQPNILARRLASKKQIVFAVIIPSVSDETDYWQEPLLGIEQAAGEIAPYGIILKKYFYDLNHKTSFVQQIDQIDLSDIHAVLIAPIFIEESENFLIKLDKRKIPYVFINSDIQGHNSLSYFGPELYQSGYLSAHLMKYVIKEDDTILIVNISHEIDNHHHLLRKEQGFRGYFKEKDLKNTILKIDIVQTDYQFVAASLQTVFKENNVSAVFVTNSRVSAVAKYLNQINAHKMLIGFDYTKENLQFLKQGSIDFLICQKPREQGYKGIMALYQFVVHEKTGEKNNFMPIDIITAQNCDFYIN